MQQQVSGAQDSKPLSTAEDPIEQYQQLTQHFFFRMHSHQQEVPEDATQFHEFCGKQLQTQSQTQSQSWPIPAQSLDFRQDHQTTIPTNDQSFQPQQQQGKRIRYRNFSRHHQRRTLSVEHNLSLLQGTNKKGSGMEHDSRHFWENGVRNVALSLLWAYGSKNRLNRHKLIKQCQLQTEAALVGRNFLLYCLCS